MSDGIEACELHDSIVAPDGSVPSTSTTSQYWNGTAKPRRMLQPIKDAIRLRAELGEAWAAYWRAKHDEVAEKLDDAVPIVTVRKLLVVAVVIGFALGRFIP